MVPFKNVLAAVDFSVFATHSAQVAAELVRAAGAPARLVLLHVHEPVAASEARLGDADPMVVFGLAALEALPPPSDRAPLYDGRLEALRQDLLERSGVRAETRVRSGAAAAQIVDAAFEEGSDLIVMGTHGRSGLLRWLMGSVAETVVRHAHCPVLTLRLPEGDGRSQQGSFRNPPLPADFAGSRARSARPRTAGSRAQCLRALEAPAQCLREEDASCSPATR